MDVPLIYLTAYSDEETVRRAKETCPSSYMTKPFKIRDLMSNIGTALYLKKPASGENPGE